MSTRVSVIAALFVIAFLATAGRLFFLQVFQYTHYEAAAEGQHAINQDVQARRGTIYGRSDPNGEKYIPLALSRRTWNIWVAPNKVDPSERDTLAERVAAILAVEKDVVVGRMAKEDDPHEPLKNGVDEETYTRIEALEHPALGATPQLGRYYPAGSLAAQTLGFVSREDGEGKYGIEEYFNSELSGTGGKMAGLRNPFGQLISALSPRAHIDDGADVRLTIDYNVQRALEQRLGEARERYSARSAQGIIVRPSTGEVIAMATVPAFDPNNYADTEDLSRFTNPLVQSVFEPGSVFKPLTMAAALDIHVVSPDMTYHDTGRVTVADRTIKNSGERVEGTQTMTQVLEKSLNTGIVEVVNRMPRGVWREYIAHFGLNEKTGIELSGEVRGDVKNVLEGGPVEIATSAFGQGVAVTPIELVMAIGALANDGVLMRPYIIDEIVTEDGEVLHEGRAQAKKQVIDTGTAEQITKMLVSVVEKGSGWGAKMDGYWVAGKTGTAQIASRGGYSDEVNHTFVGYAPAFSPEFVMLVKLENPRGVQYSEASVGPLFKDISTFVLNYYGIEPDKPLD